MVQKFKWFLTVAAKNAVNAVLTNAGLMAAFPTVFHTHSRQGLLDMLYATAIAVVVREAQIWGPIVLGWSTSATPFPKEGK